MASSSDQRRAYQGPVIFSNAFRSFFLFGGMWSALAMILWIAFLAFQTQPPSRFSGVDWHMHEMVFGYTSAVITGFLLTAVPNWTGRLPVVGRPIAGLFAVWLAGRVVVLLSEGVPPWLVALVDVGFLVALAGLLLREILAGKNWKNLPVVVLVSLLAFANALFHFEAHTGAAYGGIGIRLGVATILMLLMLIGGRVTPSFTRNWLAKTGSEARPRQAGRFDMAALGLAAIALIAWLSVPDHVVTQTICLGVAILHFYRLARWFGWHTFSEPLVTILHIGYGFAPIGFLMIALSDHLPGLSRPAHIPHAWTAGAFGIMTLAMMTRASLGHSGRALTATWPISLIYVLGILAALVRILAEIAPAEALLHLSATLWIAAFSLFFIIFLPILTRPRA